MAYGYTVKNNKKSKWTVECPNTFRVLEFITKRDAVDYMMDDVPHKKENDHVLIRKRTWREKDDELRAFNTIQTESDSLMWWDADKGLMFSMIKDKWQVSRVQPIHNQQPEGK